MSELIDEAELEELLNAPFMFTPRPKPVLGSLRPVWRIPTLLMLIRKCRGAKASLEQLHVLNWAMRDERSQHVFLAFLSGEATPDEAVVRYEPALNRALDLALGQKLVAWTDAKRLTLTEKGRDLLTSIDAQDDLLSEQKAFLERIASPVSQALVQRLLRRSP